MTDAENDKTPDSKPDTQGKGKAFFDRADEVADTSNWDFAIQMYLEGIAREPGDLERGHKPLREVSLKRKAGGGKAAGFMEKIKHSSSKDPVGALTNAEFLLAKDPGNLPHMVAVHKAAVKLDEGEVVGWIGEILLHVMSEMVDAGKKPSRQVCVMLAKSFEKIALFNLGVTACQIAARANPNDGELGDMIRNLSAKATMADGKYDGSADFTKSVVDLEGQIEDSRRGQMVLDDDLKEKDIRKAQAEYQESPTVPGKIDALVNALLRMEEESYEAEAMGVLSKAQRDTKAYRFKLRMDDIRIRQLRRAVSAAKDAGDKDAYRKAVIEQLKFELGCYAERAVEYPTDYGIKYELGLRQLKAGQVDNAIGNLQQAKRDAKRRVRALNLLGLAFHKKDLYSMAVENFQQALGFEPGEERVKELRYNLAKSLEAMGEKAKALDQFSDVAQMDYNYRDVRDCIERIRKELESGPGDAPASAPA